MDKILNSKSFKLLKKSAPNLTSISLLAFLILQDYNNGEYDTFTSVMIVVLSLCIITTIADSVLSYFTE